MGFNNITKMYEGYIYKIYNDINNKIYIGQTTTSVKDRWHGHMSACLDKNNKGALYNAMRKYGRDKFHCEVVLKIYDICFDSLDHRIDYYEEYLIKVCHCRLYENGYNYEGGGKKGHNAFGRLVDKYDINLNFIETYPSLNEAGRRNNINSSTIWSVCRHDFYTAGGYVWAYHGEIPVAPAKKERKEHIPKEKKDYVSKAMSSDVKRKNRLSRLGDDGRKIYQYNSFGEVIGIFNDLIEASEKIGISTTELKKNLSGENLRFKRTVIRYEDEPFDTYPRSKELQPITVYDLQGNVVSNFETIKDAEVFIDCARGEVGKAIKRGGSHKGYLFSYYGEPLIRKLERITKPIEMCDDFFNVVKTFSSKKEASKYFGFIDAHKHLINAIKNKTKWNGYYWKQQDEFDING